MKTVAPAFHGPKKQLQGMLGPARRADVEVNVTGTNPEEVHGRQVADRV